jgi:hypothetical protein
MKNWGEVRPPQDAFPRFDSYLELWDYCFSGYLSLLRPEVRETFVAVSHAYTEEIVRIAKNEQKLEDSVENYWPDQI